jgi:hypothetical protein
MSREFGKNAGIALLVFVIVTALAELLGATNLGTAATFGQIAFLATCLFLMLRPRA